MSFSRINAATFDDGAARSAVAAVNEAIGQIADEAAAIATDADALVADAMQAAPSAAARLMKRAEALRVRRLANMLRELQIAKLKGEAQKAIRIAATAAAEKLSRDLEAHEAELRKNALALGYNEKSADFRNLFVTDQGRRDILRVKNTARNYAGNVHMMTPDDHAHAAQLRATIAGALN
jgi:hypothetical protein